jgi:ribosomal protein L15
VAIRTEAIIRVLAKAKATTLTREALVAARIIKSVKNPVKVVLGKPPETPLAVSGVPCSKGAREAIVKAGGSVS